MKKLGPEEKYRIGRRVTLQGIAVNLILTVAKYAAGFLGRSQALLADATHSLGDLLTDFVTLWGLKYSHLPKDSDHPFGHGKIETIASAIVGMGLLGVGLMLGWNGLVQAIAGRTIVPTTLAMVVAVGTGLAKEGLFHYTYNAGQKIHSKAVLANAYDHRSDALSSIATVLGIGGAMMGLPILDPIAAIVVSIFILKAGASITMEAAQELAETSAPAAVLQEIKSVALKVQGVQRVGEIRARQVGSSVAITIDIYVDPNLTVLQGHAIADRVENQIAQQLEDAGVITVHIEPA